MRGVLDGDEAEAARGDRALRKAHVVVATPPALAEALQGPRPPFDLAAARFLVVDEVDACFQVPSYTTRVQPTACDMWLSSQAAAQSHCCPRASTSAASDAASPPCFSDIQRRWRRC